VRTLEEIMLARIEALANSSELPNLLAVRQPPRRSMPESLAEGQIRILDGWTTVFSADYHMGEDRVLFNQIHGDEDAELALVVPYHDARMWDAAIGGFANRMLRYAKKKRKEETHG
jgi:hypothetical protein